MFIKMTSILTMSLSNNCCHKILYINSVSVSIFIKLCINFIVDHFAYFIYLFNLEENNNKLSKYLYKICYENDVTIINVSKKFKCTTI